MHSINMIFLLQKLDKENDDKMSWNPFSRHSGPKKSIVSRSTERELERELKKADRLEETSRKLYKDTKRWIESNNALSNSEHKISQNLLTSQLCQTEPTFSHNVSAWEKSVEKQDLSMKEMNNNTHKTLAEPMKKLNTVFPGIQAAAKRREQSLQEYTKCQAKVNRQQDRERTGQNVVKLEMSRKALTRAKDDFEQQNQALTEDLPNFIDKRIEYLQPCVESLIKSQVSYYSDVNKIYTELADSINGENSVQKDQCKNRIQQALTDIRALSITVDD